MTPALTGRLVERYRSQTLARYRVRTKRQTLRFVEALGFCYAFTSGPGDLPGLFDVLATRSVDRMWSWAWRWKDELATERRVFYGRDVWDTFVRWMPQVVRAAGRISAQQAAAAVLDRYLQTVGAAPPRAVRGLFEWPPSTLEGARQSLGNRVASCDMDNTPVWAHVNLNRWRA